MAPARRLPGGAGTSWQIDALVLKPDQDPAEAEWTAGVYAGLRTSGFRVPRPVPAVDGSWTVDGWAAWTYVDGTPGALEHWPELIAASRAFHLALAGVPAPDWLSQERNRWVVADHVAWDGAAVELAPELADLIDALLATTRPVRLRDQLIHGDLAGNVLFADGQPPAVIDFSPYWRPAAYALAVAAVDLLAWSNAPPEILDELDDEDEIDQLLVRALACRLVTESLGRPDRESRLAVRRANAPVVDLLLSRLTGRPAAGYLTDRQIAEQASHLLGRDIGVLRPAPGGYSRSVRRIADSVFVKAGPELDVELAAYDALPASAMIASTREPVPMLVLEALAADGWVRDWTPELIDATDRLLQDLHALPTPSGVPTVAATTNPWDAISADLGRLLWMDVCSADWLAEHLAALQAAAADAPLKGASLLHRDVCAANLWHRDGRLVLVDWASAGVGDPWLDRHLWLVAMHAEGGPPPEDHQGPYAVNYAALIAGQQPLLTPSRDSNPALFQLRRRRLEVALSWSARLLGLPDPLDQAGSTVAVACAGAAKSSTVSAVSALGFRGGGNPFHRWPMT